MSISEKLGLKPNLLSLNKLTFPQTKFEITLPGIAKKSLINRARNAKISQKPTATNSPGITEIFNLENVSRFNSVLNGKAFISVSKDREFSSQGKIKSEQQLKPTFLRLWNMPLTQFGLQNSSRSSCEMLISDQLIFCGKDVTVTQSPDASKIAVVSDNMIGVYEIKSNNSDSYFKWSCSFMLPQDCIAKNVTFHVGSSALALQSTQGDVDWIEIKNGKISELSPKQTDHVQFGIRHHVAA